LLVRLVYRLGITAPPSLNRWLNRGQLLVSLLLAMFFGANDGQKIMGMVTLGLVATGFLDVFEIPLWVVAFSTVAISAGTFVGGWRLMKTLGGKFYKIRPVHGFGSQLASASILFFAGIMGGPVSGSQVITSAIVGAGSADRVQKVRWGIVQQILTSWLLTIPLSAAMGGLVYLILRALA
jgi:PiT family inorganic phosphate transporter